MVCYSIVVSAWGGCFGRSPQRTEKREAEATREEMKSKELKTENPKIEEQE